MIYLHTLAGLLNILLAIYVLKNNPAKKSNRLFSVTAFIAGLWALSNMLVFTDYRFVYPWVYLNFALGAMIPPFILHWTVEFTKYKFNRIYIYVAYLFSFILFLLALIPGFVIKDYFVPDAIGYGFKIFPGGTFAPYALCISIILLIALFILLRKRNKSYGLEKLQLNYALLGFGIPAILVIIIDFFFPLFGNTHYGNIDSLTSFIFIGIITYSITRYRFLDIKVIIRKGVVYGLSIIIALAFYTYLAILLKDYLQNTLNLSENWGIFVLILLVALGFPPLKSLVERSINTLFKGKKSIDLAVKEVQEKMANKTDIESLIDLISQEIRKFLGLEEVEILLINRQEKNFVGQERSLDFSQPMVKYLQEKGEIVVKEEIPHMLEADHEFDHKALKEVENKMNKLNVAVAIPVGKGDELIGLILLGKKKSHDAFTVEDIKFLERLSGQALFSLGNAVLYRDAMARIREMYGENS